MSAELAVVYAALILEDDNVEITVCIFFLFIFFVAVLDQVHSNGEEWKYLFVI
jgi:hypothetical protein